MREWAKAIGGSVGLFMLGVLAAFPRQELGFALMAIGAVWFVVQLWLRHRSKKPRSAPSPGAALEAELVAILEQADDLDRLGAFGDVHYGSYCFWRDKTAEFLRSTLGPAAAAAFRHRDGFKEKRAWLVGLLGSLSERKVQGDVGEAAAARREVSQGDRIGLVGGPWERS